MATTKDLTGTYGQTGNNATTDDISLIIRKNSYCAGTRDDLLSIIASHTTVGMNDTIFYTIECPVNTLIDAVIEIPGKPNVKATLVSQYDFYSAGSNAQIEVPTGDVTGTIKIKIVSVNNYPLIQDGPDIEVVDSDSNAKIPGIFVYLDKNEVNIGTNITGSITLNNLVIDDSYTVVFEHYVTEEPIVGISDFLDDSPFIATAETMVIPFSVPNTLFTSNEIEIFASIVNNTPPPPSDPP